MDDPPNHQFVVFSEISDEGIVKHKFSQCNHCGIIHKVIDICKSEIVQGKDAMNSLLTIDDLKAGLQPNLVKLLEANDVDLATWEFASFIIENKQWGSFLVLSTDEESGVKQGKYVRIMSDNLFKVESFSRDEVI